MPGYRLFFLDRFSGHILSAQAFEADDDSAAIVVAEARLGITHWSFGEAGENYTAGRLSLRALGTQQVELAGGQSLPGRQDRGARRLHVRLVRPQWGRAQPWARPLASQAAYVRFGSKADTRLRSALGGKTAHPGPHFVRTLPRSPLRSEASSGTAIPGHRIGFAKLRACALVSSDSFQIESCRHMLAPMLPGLCFQNQVSRVQTSKRCRATLN